MNYVIETQGEKVRSQLPQANLLSEQSANLK